MTSLNKQAYNFYKLNTNTVIGSYLGKSTIVYEFESSRGSTWINHRWMRNTIEMMDTTILEYW